MRFSTLSSTDPFTSKPSKLASVRGVIGSVEAILRFYARLVILYAPKPQKDVTRQVMAPILMKVRRFQKLLQYDRYRLLSAYPTLPTCRPIFAFFENFFESSISLLESISSNKVLHSTQSPIQGPLWTSKRPGWTGVSIEVTWRPVGSIQVSTLACPLMPKSTPKMP